MDRWESYKSDTGATWTDKILTNTPENLFFELVAYDYSCETPFNSTYIQL